jgi:plastocyanin
MQSTTSRVALVVVAVVIAVAAFLVLRPGDDDEDGAPATAGQTEAPGGERSRGGDGAAGYEEQAPPEAETTTIEIRNGDVAGGVEEIEVENGDRIEFAVESDAPDEIHVHGYELAEEVAPGEPAEFSFPADLEGIYEVEAHDIGHVVIAELRVSPP